MEISSNKDRLHPNTNDRLPGESVNARFGLQNYYFSLVKQRERVRCQSGRTRSPPKVSTRQAYRLLIKPARLHLGEQLTQPSPFFCGYLELHQINGNFAVTQIIRMDNTGHSLLDLPTFVKERFDPKIANPRTLSPTFIELTYPATVAPERSIRREKRFRVIVHKSSSPSPLVHLSPHNIAAGIRILRVGNDELRCIYTAGIVGCPE